MKHRRTATVQRILGFLIAGSSLMMVPPALVSLWYQDGTADLFMVSAVILFITGMVIFLPVRHINEDIRVRDGFLIVAVCWLSLALVGAVPFLLLMEPENFLRGCPVRIHVRSHHHHRCDNFNQY